jgi:hypothetical protein
MSDVQFRLGAVGDADAIRALLRSAALPVDDLGRGSASREFVVAEVGVRLVGSPSNSRGSMACCDPWSSRWTSGAGGSPRGYLSE